MKKSNKPLKEAHTSNKKFGMGDNYPVGIRQKTGKTIDSFLNVGIKPKNSKKTKIQVV